MTEEEREADLNRVKQAIAALGEHFDTVQIFVTRHESGEDQGTINVKWGIGNWFARFGQVRDYVLKEEQAIRLEVRPIEDD